MRYQRKKYQRYNDKYADDTIHQIQKERLFICIFLRDMCDSFEPLLRIVLIIKRKSIRWKSLAKFFFVIQTRNCKYA